ncbi:MAG: hypothetical protein AB9856_03645 [Cellulosilyticaceae bacterium]
MSHLFQNKIHELTYAVSYLLNDFSSFAEIANAVQLQNYSFDIMDSFCYPVSVQYFSIKKSFVKSAIDAFVILYIKKLYLGEDWGDTTLWFSWTNSLRNLWIPQYFKHIDIKPMKTRYFLSEITYWMKHNKHSSQEINLFIDTHQTAYVIEVRQVYAGHSCFGETENEYFVAEFGCGYD